MLAGCAPTEDSQIMLEMCISNIRICKPVASFGEALRVCNSTTLRGSDTIVVREGLKILHLKTVEDEE